MTRVRAEVITGVQRRRRCTRLQKERIVAAALEPGVVASQIARRAGIHSSQLLRWRKQLYQPAGPTLMPVTITPEPVIPAAPATPALIETAELNGVDALAWLADVVRRLPDHPASRLHELLPWAWNTRPRAEAA